MLLVLPWVEPGVSAALTVVEEPVAAVSVSWKQIAEEVELPVGPLDESWELLHDKRFH